MKLSNIWNSLNKFRDNLAFSLDKGATYGPSKPVQDELAGKGWTFRAEAVAMPQAGVAVSLHPILNGVEISETKKGRITAEWEQYETDRLTAVYKVHNRPLPEVLPVAKAGTLTAMAAFRRSVNHWLAKHEVFGPDEAVIGELKKQGWSFKPETIDAVSIHAMPVTVYRPVTPEGRKLEPGDGNPQWPRYETARLAAVEKLYGKEKTSAGPVCGCS
jgi:hypothetical protein